SRTPASKPYSTANARRSMPLNATLFGDLRRSTLSWWRRARISASSRALDRNSLVSAHASSVRKSIIGNEHHPIRHLLASRMKFPVGTAPSWQAKRSNRGRVRDADGADGAAQQQMSRIRYFLPQNWRFLTGPGYWATSRRLRPRTQRNGGANIGL